MTSYFSK